MAILPAKNITFDITIPIAIIGAGACGLVAALAVKDGGVEPVVFERDGVPQGSTALSAGMIPACETRIQAEKGVGDSVAAMAADIQRKAKGEADPDLVAAMCQASGPAIDWLTDAQGIELTLVEGFLYSGHSFPRMHGPVSRTGADLIGALVGAAERTEIEIVTNAHVTDLFADPDGSVRGLKVRRPDGKVECIGCDALILACNGFGGNAEMLKKHIPDMVEANYFGHKGNQGDAVIWGEALGAATRHLGAYQGHGSVAHPHGILISWALMMEGGIQINLEGKRFSNEHEGYSEQGRKVMAQSDGIAWNIFDTRLFDLAMDFEDFRQANASGAIFSSDGVEDLAQAIGVPPDALAATMDESVRLSKGQGVDPFGRDFSTKPALKPPYKAIKVTGALFHTQGGLVVDADARVKRPDGSLLPNLYAGGGAACGVSGSSDWGYLSGNGLLAAVTLGRLVGQAAARQVSEKSG